MKRPIRENLDGLNTISYYEGQLEEYCDWLEDQLDDGYKRPEYTADYIYNAIEARKEGAEIIDDFDRQRIIAKYPDGSYEVLYEKA